MPTYLGWNVVTIPPNPSSPASIEFGVTENVAMSMSPFTSQQQVQDWGGNYMQASVQMPAMIFSVAQNWVTFLRALKGPTCVFQFSTAFMTAYSGDIGTRYWRLKSNTVKWSVNRDRTYSLQFDVIEAL